MSPRTRAAILAASLLVAPAWLTACGSDGSEDAATAQDPAGESSSPSPSETADESAGTAPSASPSPEATDEAAVLPACSEIWTVDTRVPGSYEGCLDGETTVPADGRYCEFGKPLFTYRKNFYAVAGGPVIATERPLLRDPGYRDALRKCGG